MDTAKGILGNSGAPSARSMLTSVTIHVLAMAVLLLVPAEALRQSERPRAQVDIVFHRPAPVAIPAPPGPPAPRGGTPAGPKPEHQRPAPPKPAAPPGPPELPPAVAEAPPQPQVGKMGIL